MKKEQQLNQQKSNHMTNQNNIEFLFTFNLFQSLSPLSFTFPWSQILVGCFEKDEGIRVSF